MSDYIHLDAPGATPQSPLLFLLHGTGGDEHQFFDFAAGLVPGARRIAPRGDVSEGGANRYFRRLAEGRYDMVDLARATGKLSDFIAAKRDSAPGAPVYALGYSNGANILASVLFARPDLVDRAVLMHPLIPFTPDPHPGLAGRKVLITAGRNDPICPAPQSEALATWLRGQAVDVDLVWHPGGHELRGEEAQAARDFLAA